MKLDTCILHDQSAGVANVGVRDLDRRQFFKSSMGALATMAALTHAEGSAKAKPISEDWLHANEYRQSRRFVRTPFGNIAYVEQGEGEVALFLHGFPLNSFQWRHALERLSFYRRCIAPDFLAMGSTEVAEGQDVGPDAQAGMIIAFMDALAIEAVDLVASDSGGAIAQLLVARHPRRVRTVLLTNCDSEIECPPPALMPVIKLSKQGRYVDEWLVPWQKDKRRARSVQGFGGMCYAERENPSDAAIDAYFAPLMASAQRKSLVHAYAIALEGNSLAGIGAALKRSDIPTRILWGKGDTIFSAKGAEHLGRAFGNSLGVRYLEESKLFWPEERPDVIAEEARLLWKASLPWEGKAGS
ncbi:MAG: alpha/beta hydrolase [Usitatibacteraceae bacterium]